MRRTTGGATLRGRAVALGAITLLIVGCSDDGGGVTPIDDPPTEPDGTAPDEPTDPEPEDQAADDPFAVPDEITVDYVQSVVDELLPLWIDAEAQALEEAPTEAAPRELQDTSRAIRSPDESALYLISIEPVLRDVADAEERADGLRTPQWTVTSIAHEADGCLIVDFDYPPGAEADSGRQVLLDKVAERDPEGRNPTPWVLDRGGPLGVGAFDDLDQVIERCDAERVVTDDVDEGDDQ